MRLGIVPVALPFLLATAWSPPAAAEEPPPPGPQWGQCPEGDYGAGMRCAPLEVPVDHADPDGRTITIMLGRLAADGGAPAEGSVLVNPGGPVGAAIEMLGTYPEPFAGLRETMDVVTWDLRGDPGGMGGFSTPLECELKGVLRPEVPADQEAFDELAAANRATARECRDTDPVLFDHMSSADHARDMEAVRAALGEPRLNLHMTSYGGVLGQSYAALFPDRVRTLFLDGVADHGAEGDEVYEGFARDGEAGFRRFTDWCAETESCALYGRDIPALWQDLVAEANAEPIPAPVADTSYSGRDLQEAAVRVVSYQEPGDAWGALAQAVADAEGGDASGFVANPERPHAVYAVPAVVECLDWNRPADHAELAATVARLEEAAPSTGGRLQMYGAMLTCVGWPAPVANPPAEPVDGIPPLLGAGTWNDFGSTDRAVRRVPGGVTIERDGPGHGLYWSGDACVIGHADRYLATGELPPAGTQC